jgi:serine/threonine protein phosphatase PrpC
MPAELPPVGWISATVAKAGHRPEENEDAVAAAPERLRFAVADGATEGWESGGWAARLAAAYVRRPPNPGDFPGWLAAARRGWLAPTEAGPVPWYAAVKSEQGSFATLAGLELRHSRRGGAGWGWKAVAVGDSCLVHVRSGGVEGAFPHATAGAFGNHPPLVPSSPDVPCPEPDWLAGRADPGDLLLLATDAAAARLLDPTTLAPALAAVRAALRAGDRAPLLDWFRELQAAVNDDVSVIAVRLPGGPEVP